MWVGYFVSKFLAASAEGLLHLWSSADWQNQQLGQGNDGTDATGGGIQLHPMQQHLPNLADSQPLSWSNVLLQQHQQDAGAVAQHQRPAQAVSRHHKADQLPSAPLSNTPTSVACSVQSDLSAVACPPCAICGDRGTGKHYGAHSCDGCKGFFRRTVRKKRIYVCRFDRNCLVDKDRRNSCRHCRFQRCLAAGMRRESVQSERDRISEPRSLSHQSNLSQCSAARPHWRVWGVCTLDSLVCAERLCATKQEYKRDSVIARSGEHGGWVQMATGVMLDPGVDQVHGGGAGRDGRGELRAASVEDVTDAMHQQLLFMVEWAKTLAPFAVLSMDDQIALLRNYAPQHLLLTAAHRTYLLAPPASDHRGGNLDNALYLTNETFLPRDPPPGIPDVNHVASRIMDEVLRPMRQLDIDQREYVALKGIAFFNPNSVSLPAQPAVAAVRQELVQSLADHLNLTGRANSPAQRLANLLLMLPSLQAIAQALIENIELAQVFGTARIDALLEELIVPVPKSLAKSQQQSNSIADIKTVPSTSHSNSTNFTIINMVHGKQRQQISDGINEGRKFPE